MIFLSDIIITILITKLQILGKNIFSYSYSVQWESEPRLRALLLPVFAFRMFGNMNPGPVVPILPGKQSNKNMGPGLAAIPLAAWFFPITFVKFSMQY